MGLEFDGVNGIIKNTTSDGDVTIKGNDGGSEISLLAFDVSAEGVATFNKDVKLGDNSKALFGAGSDLEIYHDGSNSIISDAGTGSIEIQSNGTGVFLQKSASEYLARFLTDGAVELRYDNAVKLATTSTGIDITGAFTATAASTITTADNTDTLSLVSTDTDAAIGPNLNLYRNAGNGADADNLSTIAFAGNDDAGNATDFARITAQIEDASNGSEDVYLYIRTITGGTERQRLGFDSGSTVFNEEGVDIDFRVESDGNANMFFVDGGENRVGFGTGTPGRDYQFLTTDQTDVSIIAANNQYAQLLFGDPDDDNIGSIGYNNSSNAMEFHANATQIFTIHSDGVVFNEASNDQNFRIESNGDANMLFVDAGNDKIGVGHNNPSQLFSVKKDQNTDTAIRIANGTGGTAARASLFMDVDSGGAQLMAIDDGFSTSGPYIADNVTFVSDTAMANGMTIGTRADSSNAHLRFYTKDAERMRITGGGEISTGGEAAPDVTPSGICLNQAASDQAILTFKSSDVAHGMTVVSETDTYVSMSKNSDGGGALNLTTLSETATAFRHVACATGSNTAESLAATSVWGVDTRLKDGSSVTGPGADDNIASFRTSDQAQVIFKGDGEIFSNQSATVGTYDAYEDAQLVRAYDLSHMKGVIDSKFDKFVQYNKDDLQKARLIGTDDDGNATSFVNWTGMSRLHNGAIWQQYEKHQKLVSAFYKLAEKTIGKEEADKLLTEEEIQLLN